MRDGIVPSPSRPCPTDGPFRRRGERPGPETSAGPLELCRRAGRGVPARLAFARLRPAPPAAGGRGSRPALRYRGPESPGLNYNLGACLLQIGDNDQAETYLRKTLRLGQFQGEATCVWASVVLYESSGKAKEALEEARRLSEGQPEGVSIPVIGDGSTARFYFPRGVPHSCGGGDGDQALHDVDAEVAAVVFHKGRIEGSITFWTLAQGTSVDAAVEFARKQLARIDAASEE